MAAMSSTHHDEDQDDAARSYYEREINRLDAVIRDRAH
jgi:hypothetical protein